MSVDDDAAVEQDHGSRVSLRSSSHLMAGLKLESRIAFSARALVSFGFGISR